MKNSLVVLLTQQAYIRPDKDDQYHRNILQEDALLSEALTLRGCKVQRVAWDDQNFNWSSAACAVFRATWDYFHRISEFTQFLERVKEQTLLINGYDTVKWNMDKRYLRDMSVFGVNIPETLFLEVGERRSLREIMQVTDWETIVLKPAISGAARHTYLIDLANCASHEKLFTELVSNEAMLIQRFQPDVVRTGEWTFVVVNGRYTHGILKKAKKGDFRVQDDFGGTVHDHVASAEEIQFAERVMSLIKPLPAYGRVDVIRDVNGEMALQELELIEPELWFRNNPTAADLLAEHILKKIL